MVSKSRVRHSMAFIAIRTTVGSAARPATNHRRRVGEFVATLFSAALPMQTVPENSGEVNEYRDRREQRQPIPHRVRLAQVMECKPVHREKEKACSEHQNVIDAEHRASLRSLPAGLCRMGI